MSTDAFNQSALQVLQTAAQAVAQAAQAVNNASEAVKTSAEALKLTALAFSSNTPTSMGGVLNSEVYASTEEMSEEELVAVIAAAAADVLGVHVNQVQVVDIHEDHSWRMQGRNAIHHSHRLR